MPDRSTPFPHLSLRLVKEGIASTPPGGSGRVSATILSDSLKAEWNQILEQQEYIIDIGVSCINIQEQYSRCPKRNESESDEKYQKRVSKWLDKHNLSPEDWDDLYSERTDQLQRFISQYNGEILRNIAGDEIGISRLPDSFSCRIRILGKGLKDLVLNFPYIFDVSEPDEFGAPSVTPNESDFDRETFTLEPPDPNAPKVCVIDSGIQVQQPLQVQQEVRITVS